MVLEVGVLRGQLAERLLAGRKDLRYAGIDGWVDGNVEYLPGALALAKQCAVARVSPFANRACLLQGDTSTVMRELAEVGFRFDLVFIDADHTYEGVMKDIKAALPLVAPGCWIGGHDYGDHVKSVVKGLQVGVKRAVDELEDRRILSVVEHGSNNTWFSRKSFTNE
jgi:hypothetical protein